MVFFTCMHCGEALKKPRVEKHFQFQCRKTISVSCMDCFKDFQGQEYVAHTKCITEAQRYGGKDFVQRPSKNKGERKQQDWILVVHSVIENTANLSAAEKSVLQTLSSYENVPRKKLKFFNFMKNAFPGRANVPVMESVWAKLEEAFKKASENKISEGKNDEGVGKTSSQEDVVENENNENLSKEYTKAEAEGKQNGNSGGDDTKVEQIETDGAKRKSKKVKKRKITESVETEEQRSLNSDNKVDEKFEEGQNCLAEVEQNGIPSKRPKKSKTKNVFESSDGTVAKDCLNNGENISDNNEVSIKKFDWSEAILNIVRSKEEISLKKLKKKILAEYRIFGNKPAEEKTVAKFDKKLNKISEIIVIDGKVKLAK